MVYVPTVWANDVAPALSATNLNKLTDEIEVQAATHSVPHSLPNWTNNAAPALTDPAPWNEIERVVTILASQTGVSFSPVTWQAGWTPARNAARLNRLEAAMVAIADAGTQPPPTGFHWNETFESGLSPPSGWSLEKARWPGGTGYTGVSDTYLADPWGGGNGQVVRFRCTADFSLPMSYDLGQRQLISYYRQISNSFSGTVNGVNRETWYRTKFGFPAGTHFSQGMWHFLQEWHHDGNTWGGGGSPGMNIYGDYPLTNGQPAANPRLAVVWRHGSSTDPSPGQYPGETYWPNTAQGQLASWQPINLQYDHWYDSVFRVIWSLSATQGLVQWWLDGVLRINRTMQTQVANPSLPGGSAQNFFGIYNYRYNINVDSDVYFAQTAAGPTAASVGFVVP